MSRDAGHDPDRALALLVGDALIGNAAERKGGDDHVVKGRLSWTQLAADLRIRARATIR